MNGLLNQGLQQGLGEMTSLLEIKRRLAAIEQGQSVLCERLDKISVEDQEHYNRLLILIGVVMDGLSKKLDCLQGAALLSQFENKEPEWLWRFGYDSGVATTQTKKPKRRRK